MLSTNFFKKISECFLVDGYFHLNSKFISKSSYPLQRHKSFKKKKTNLKNQQQDKKAQETKEEKRISLENLTGHDDIVCEIALCYFARFFLYATLL